MESQLARFRGEGLTMARSEDKIAPMLFVLIALKEGLSDYV